MYVTSGTALAIAAAFKASNLSREVIGRASCAQTRMRRTISLVDCSLFRYYLPGVHFAEVHRLSVAQPRANANSNAKKSARERRRNQRLSVT
jgi:hypothetical protein